ncbi:MAG: precorrin-2 C(20)-methyltransferase [Microcystaceae cyanobacterium]
MTDLGTLYGISVGTGDPELITVKGLKRLQQSEVIAFPKGLNDSVGFAQKIVTPWLTSKQQLLPLDFPYVQDETKLKNAWQSAAKTVLSYLKKGQDVAFVCEGDISFYSTFTYLAQTLQTLDPEIIIETIAGVCSPMAMASVLGIPLTRQDQSLAILPALYRFEELDRVLNWADVIVLMKVASVYEKVWQILAKRGLLEQAKIVERATLPEQKVYDNLQDLPQLKLSYFSVLVIVNSVD